MATLEKKMEDLKQMNKSVFKSELTKFEENSILNQTSNYFINQKQVSY